MRLSILCVRDYLSIFYSGLFHGSSVLGNPFQWMSDFNEATLAITSSVLGNPFQWASPACSNSELFIVVFL